MNSVNITIVLVLLSAFPVAAQRQPSPTFRESRRELPPKSKQTTAAETTIENKMEAFLRHLYAWGPTFHLRFTSIEEAEIPGLYKVTVAVSTGGQSNSAVLYVTHDGRYLIRGEVQDMNADPLAEARSRISLADTPSKGDVNASVIIVEYADYECPSCRQLDRVLRSILSKYPKVKLYYKNFPLSQIHPWAMTAAIAGQCAFQQTPTAFWKVHDAIFDNQDIISPEIVWQKIVSYATQAGLDSDAFKACMADPRSAAVVNKTVQEGLRLHIANTPTLFVNGRRLIGADPDLLEQYINYELEVGREVHPPAPVLKK